MNFFKNLLSQGARGGWLSQYRKHARYKKDGGGVNVASSRAQQRWGLLSYFSAYAGACPEPARSLVNFAGRLQMVDKESIKAAEPGIVCRRVYSEYFSVFSDNFSDVTFFQQASELSEEKPQWIAPEC